MSDATVTPACPLCATDGGTVLWREGRLRVVAIDDADYPGFLRVIWDAHVREMSELDTAARIRLMEVVFGVESAVRRVLTPDKINLASLGNVVPHLHWHIIARYADDAHFPDPVWGVRRRDPDPARLATQRAKRPELIRAVVEMLQPSRCSPEPAGARADRDEGHETSPGTFCGSK